MRWSFKRDRERATGAAAGGAFAGPYLPLLGALREGVLVAGASGSVVAFNASATRILGAAPEDLAGLSIHDPGPRWRVIDQDGSPLPAREYPLAQTLSTGHARDDVLLGVEREGVVRWLSVNTRMLRGRVGEPAALAVACFADVTDRLVTVRSADRPALPPLLSPRQREILQLLAAGKTGNEIAALLYLSSETVRTHVRNAIVRLGAQTRSHAIAIAMARGEISAVPPPARSDGASPPVAS